MSKKLTTRHARFMYSMGECMDLLSNELCAIDNTFPGLSQSAWKIQQYSPTYYAPELKKYKQYMLVVSKEYVLYHIDVRHIDSQGRWHEVGPFKQTIQGITPSLVANIIHEYYSPYYRLGELGEIKAKVCVIDDVYLDTPTEIGFHIGVLYHNGYNVPFPVPADCLSPKETILTLERSNRALRQEIYDLDEENEELFAIVENARKVRIRLKKEKVRLAEKIEHNTSRMANKIRELYKAQGKWDECPVCYSDILPEVLVIRGCCHTICESCDSRCDTCPICRECKV